MIGVCVTGNEPSAIKMIRDAFVGTTPELSQVWSRQILQDNWGHRIEPGTGYADRTENRIRDVESFRDQIALRGQLCPDGEPLAQLGESYGAYLDAEWPGFVEMSRPVPEYVERAVKVRRAAIEIASGGRARVGVYGLGDGVMSAGAVNLAQLSRTVHAIVDGGFCRSYMTCYTPHSDVRLVRNQARRVEEKAALLERYVRVVRPDFSVEILLKPVNGGSLVAHSPEVMNALCEEFIGRDLVLWLQGDTIGSAVAYADAIVQQAMALSSAVEERRGEVRR